MSLNLSNVIDLQVVKDTALGNGLLSSVKNVATEVATGLTLPPGQWRSHFTKMLSDKGAVDELLADVGEAIGAGHGAAKGQKLAGALGHSIGKALGAASGRQDGGDIIS